MDFNASICSNISTPPTPSMPVNYVLTRAEFFHELRNYVKLEDFQILKSKHERLKRRVKSCGNNEEELDEYSALIKDFGKDRLYDATKVLFQTA